MIRAASELWGQAAERLRKLTGEATWRRWFEPIRPLRKEGDALILEAPCQFHRIWLEDNHRGLIEEALGAAAGQTVKVRLESAPEEPKTEETAPALESRREPARGKGTLEAAPLNAQFTFDRFVVGASSQYAHAAAWAVAHSPGRAYNPLFIYGATGLGKSHLLHAVGHHLMAQNRGARIAYVTTERFVNEFIDAIQNSRYVPFRKKYRNCDVLLIDDIHFLSKGEKIQEEFFHNFNVLHEAHRQIVLSSDRPATEIANLEERLVTRFEWGLTVQLQPPDQETRLAILRKKQEQAQHPLPEETLEYLALHIKSNVRRLEGAWAKLWFATRLKGRPLALSEVEEEVSDLVAEESRAALTTETIQKRVAAYYDVRQADMTSKRRSASIAFPRQVAMYLCRALTSASLQQVGEAFGGRDHGTVIYACRVVEARLKSNPSLKQAINQITKQLNQ
ncbi:MAG: chromosomal replication initiator protein DnaA [Verrucomicrobiae bacterium]|nr:chromosomal replication initiator protein DnaA [Verrucomicrobiae bacterium]